ncbi:MAG: hypothetical protein QGG95_02855, partial [Nitrospinota bacterium]|nr:hypothetical protein [Nitrospinota bacterium]
MASTLRADGKDIRPVRFSMPNCGCGASPLYDLFSPTLQSILADDISNDIIYFKKLQGDPEFLRFFIYSFFIYQSVVHNSSVISGE